MHGKYKKYMKCLLFHRHLWTAYSTFFQYSIFPPQALQCALELICVTNAASKNQNLSGNIC